MKRFWIALALALPLATAHAETGELADGVARYRATEYAAAETIFRRILAADPEDYEAAYYLGFALIAQEKWDDALDVTAHLSDAVPGNARYRRLYAEALGRKAERAPLLKRPGMAKKSLRAFEEAVALDPRDLAARDSLMEFYLQAPGFMGGGRDKALAQAEAMAELDPWQGHRARARIFRYHDEPQQAIAEYRAALEKDSKNVAAWHLLGQTYAELERWEPAFDALGRGLAVDPDHRPTLFELGRAAARSGRKETIARAISALERFVALPPRHLDPPAAEAYLHLGLLRRLAGDEPAARGALERALVLDPELQDARKALQRR